MSETTIRIGASEIDESPEELMIAGLVDFARETLNAEGITPQGANHARILEKDDLPHGTSELRETIKPETGLKEYEYSEVNINDPRHQVIYRWSEGGRTLAKLIGSTEDDSMKPLLLYERVPDPDDEVSLNWRMSRLRTPTA